jgi:hypothetical protein
VARIANKPNASLVPAKRALLLGWLYLWEWLFNPNLYTMCKGGKCMNKHPAHEIEIGVLFGLIVQCELLVPHLETHLLATH